MSQEIFRGPNSPCCKYFSAVSFMVEGNGFIFRTDLKIVDPLNISFSGGCNFSFPSKPLLPGECRPAGRILLVNMMYFVNVKFRERQHIGTFSMYLNIPTCHIHAQAEIGAVHPSSTRLGNSFPQLCGQVIPGRSPHSRNPGFQNHLNRFSSRTSRHKYDSTIALP